MKTVSIFYIIVYFDIIIYNIVSLKLCGNCKLLCCASGFANVLDPVGGSEKYGGRGRGNRPGSMSGRGGRNTGQNVYDNAGPSAGATAPYASGDPAALRPRSNRRNNFRRTDPRSRDSGEQVFDVSGGRSSKQSGNGSGENLDSVTGIDTRDTDSPLQERGYSGESTRRFRATSEGGASSQTFSRSERTGGNDASRKSGGKAFGASDQAVESLLGKHLSEATVESHGSTHPGGEREDDDDFIEVRSKRQMLSDRRAVREKEIKAKSNLKVRFELFFFLIT